MEELTKARIDDYHQLEALHWLISTIRFRAPLRPMRNMAISPDFGLLLSDTIATYRPRNVVELGCGVSTVISATILREQSNVNLVSVDHDATFLDECRQELEKHGLAEFAHLFHCPLRSQVIEGETWNYYDLSRAELPTEIDLLIVDGPPGWTQPLARYPALKLLHSRLSKKSIILVDDALRGDEAEMVRRWMAETPRFELRHLPTEKGAVLLVRCG